jgi:crotonobetainyl-CoA:carnitine CoA-transferase CaiB-like acyl-CoA transferase
MIDVALYESVFNVMESLLPEHSVFDAIRQPAGSSLPALHRAMPTAVPMGICPYRR